MRNQFRCLFAAGACLLSAACDRDAALPGTPDPNSETKQAPVSLSASRTGWRIHDGGIAERRGGLVVDIADGGILRRDVKAPVPEGGVIELMVNLDANGDQRLEFRMAGGCGRDPVASEYSELVHLENGYNRVTVANRFEKAERCLIVELLAKTGPVSLFIEDATLYWKDR